MIPGVQEWIHKFEVGEGTRHIRLAAVVLGLLALTVSYDFLEFKNFSTQEAMDGAQLARNISEGKGYTTDFIRPLSIYLTQRLRTENKPVLREAHPDLANPPVYPFILSCLMKVLPFHYDIPKGIHLRYQPELLIGIFNQALFFVAVFLVYRLAIRLFDKSVAWVSALIFAGTNVLWRFSVSGLSTMLLLLVFLSIVWCLVALEEHGRAGTRSNGWFLTMALAVGGLVGMGGLTRYSFGWLLLPVMGFLVLFFGQRRTVLCGAALGAFLVVMSPWLVRNHAVGGTLFGISGYALYHDTTPPFRGNRLDRFLTKDFEAELSRVEFDDCLRKLLINSSNILEKELPNLAGNWTSAFFLVGLLLPFRNAALNRIRVFVLMSLGLLIIVQALGKTQLSVESPDINTENLLVLVTPMVFIFGVGMYFILLDQVNLPIPQLRSAVTALFALLACAPLIFALLPPRSFPIVYQPYTPPNVFDVQLIRYWPPAIQDVSRWMREDELMMSDMPWAVAWYGDRQCVWVTQDAPSDSKPAISSDFFTLNDYQKPIHALYLTTLTSDARFYSQMVKDKNYDWGRFMIESLAKQNVPKVFPLKKAPRGFMENGQLFLSDRARWDETPP